MKRWDYSPRPWEDQWAPRIDKGMAYGLAGALGLVGLAVVSTGSLLQFLSPVGILFVFGGSLAATMVQAGPSGIADAWRAFTEALFYSSENPSNRIRQLVDLAQRLKIDGPLVLEDEAAATDDRFLRLGLELVVDGRSGDDLRRVLETDMRVSNETANRSVFVFECLGNFAPAVGLIGTLIGLIQMLGKLSDAAVVGPSMSLALIATMYGAVFANLIFFPVAGKLQAIANERARLKLITLEGLMSLSNQESPILVQQRLQSFESVAANG